MESILDYYHIPFIFFPFSISQELKKKVILIIMHILFRFVYILGSLSYVYYTGNYSGSYRGHLKVISKQIRVNMVKYILKKKIQNSGNQKKKTKR